MKKLVQLAPDTWVAPDTVKAMMLVSHLGEVSTRVYISDSYWISLPGNRMTEVARLVNGDDQ